MIQPFPLLDPAWIAIEPLLPGNQPDARGAGDRRAISGIAHALRSGCRWHDSPSKYGPPITLYNRFNRRDRLRAFFLVRPDLRTDNEASEAYARADARSGSDEGVGFEKVITRAVKSDSQCTSGGRGLGSGFITNR